MAAPRILRPIRVGKGWEWRVTDRQLTLLLKRATTAQRARARAIVKESLRLYSPKLTGRLSQSWTALINLQGQLRVRSKVVYSRYQNDDSPRVSNRGFILRALDAAARIIIQSLRLGETPEHSFLNRSRFGRVGEFGIRLPARDLPGRPSPFQFGRFGARGGRERR